MEEVCEECCNLVYSLGQTLRVEHVDVVSSSNQQPAMILIQQQNLIIPINTCTTVPERGWIVAGPQLWGMKWERELILICKDKWPI